MIGHNKLNLSAATVMEAVQEYLDKRMGVHAPHVVSITHSRTSPYHETFCVSVEGNAPSNCRTSTRKPA